MAIQMNVTTAVPLMLQEYDFKESLEWFQKMDRDSVEFFFINQTELGPEITYLSINHWAICYPVLMKKI